MTAHVAVLMGGWSAEREVSLVSGQAVSEALERGGYRVTPVDVGRDVGRALEDLRPDIAFNALHGRFGEDGCIQGMLEVLGIRYTHSGVLASALAMDKPVAKRLFAVAGIPCAEGKVVPRQAVLDADPMPRPYVVKPLNEGSSVGVKIIREGDAAPFTADDWPFGDRVLVERYIPGHEIHVAMLDDAALGAVEIRPREGFYYYEAKYTAGKAEHLMPAPLSDDAYKEALRLGLAAHRALGCRGVTRADFRYDDTGDPPGGFYLLEINTQPGMTPLSLVPEIAAHAGVGFDQLVSRLAEEARCDG